MKTLSYAKYHVIHTGYNAYHPSGISLIAFSRLIPTPSGHTWEYGYRVVGIEPFAILPEDGWEIEPWGGM